MTSGPYFYAVGAIVFLILAASLRSYWRATKN